MPFRLSSSRLHVSSYLSNSVQFRGHSHRLASIRCLIAAVHIGSPQRPVDSVRHVCHRRHAVAILVVSLLSFSAPRSAISALVMSEPFNSTSIPLPVSSSPSAPFMAIPLLVASVRFWAVPYPRFSRQCRIKSSPLQSAPIRFFALHCFTKQGGSNPLPLVSGRFRLCSALPSQILESHLQSLPWLLFAFLAGPFRIRSDPCASARLGSVSARFGSCPSFAIAPPCLSGRIVSPQRRRVTSLLRADLIRCHSTRIKSGLITSVANRGCALQSPGSSTQPAPISTVPVRFPSAQFGTPPFHLYSSSILSRRRRAIAPRFCTGRIPTAHRRFGSKQGVTTPWRFLSIAGRASRIRCSSSPSDSGLICAAPLPRFTCQVYSMPSRVGAADRRFTPGNRPCCRRSRCRHRPALPSSSGPCRCCATGPARAAGRSPGTPARPFPGCPAESRR